MSNFVKVEGHAGLVRDMGTGVILNVNSTEFDNFRNRKLERQRQVQKLNTLEAEVAELKAMLKNLLEKTQ